MAIRNILLENEDPLRKKSRIVTSFDDKLAQLLDDMADTMKAADGVGLAAPQVGVLRSVTIVDIGEGVIEFINPEIKQTWGNVEDTEGCLSCPGEYGVVVRPHKISLTACDRHGKSFIMEAEDLLARAICHEIDHLYGKIFKDIAIRMVDMTAEK